MKNHGKSTRGTTMVEVIVAFVVLLLIMGMFSQALSLAGTMLGRADHTLEQNRQLAGDYYQDEDGAAAFHVEGIKDWEFKEKNGKSGSFSVRASLRTYTNPKGDGIMYDLIPETKAPTGE